MPVSSQGQLLTSLSLLNFSLLISITFAQEPVNKAYPFSDTPPLLCLSRNASPNPLYFQRNSFPWHITALITHHNRKAKSPSACLSRTTLLRKETLSQKARMQGITHSREIKVPFSLPSSDNRHRKNKAIKNQTPLPREKF